MARMQDQLARYDRAPFQGALAKALINEPGHKHWRDMAKADPEKWSRSVAMLAKAAGYADKSERISVNLDPATMARELVARFGHTRALSLLEAAGLPASLIPLAAIDGHSEPLTGEPCAVRIADSTNQQGHQNDGKQSME